MLVHAGVGGTKKNNGTGCQWDGLKKAVSGTRGSTAGQALDTVISALLRCLTGEGQCTGTLVGKSFRFRVNPAAYNGPTSVQLNVRK